MEIVWIVLLALSATAGFLLGKYFSAHGKKKQQLEAKLQQTQAELESYRSKVNSHFEKSAQLFDRVSDSYQALYDHMAKSSSRLCATETFQSLPKTSATEASAITSDKDSHKDENFFDAEHLYNAHNYRNQKNQQPVDQTKTADLTESNPQDNKNVVDIESAKNPELPAQDYARKD